MVLISPPISQGRPRTHPHLEKKKKKKSKRRESLESRITLCIHVTAIEFTHMCTSSPGLSVYCLYTCRSDMCAALNDYIPPNLQSVLVAFFGLTSRRKKTKCRKRGEKKSFVCHCERSKGRRGWGGGSRYMNSSEIALLSKQDDQLCPYIDVPAIILSSNGLNNRALSEAAN